MHASVSVISIDLSGFKPGLVLSIFEEYDNSLFIIPEEEGAEFGESIYQLVEGRSYGYAINNIDFQLKVHDGIVRHSRRIGISEGRITTHSFVGTLTLFLRNEIEDLEFPVHLEVLATKLDSTPDKSYRQNYRFMLESITKKCTELLLQINSPVNQFFETDFEANNKTVYQRFAFAQSLLISAEFNEAVQKIIASPSTKWATDSELKDVRKVGRINNSELRQIASSSNRVPIDSKHPLSSKHGIYTIPSKILSAKKIETVDTAENRFIKHALENYLKFCTECEHYFSRFKYAKAEKEAGIVIKQLDSYLGHSFFKGISRPNTLKLNSPVLQRKAGYREILNSWLMFDLAAKLTWKGGEKVYAAGKRDVATLYEYWLFFCLYDLVKEKFGISRHSYEDLPYEHLISPTADGLNVMVKSGKHTALEGIFTRGNRKLNIKFSYNRTFSGDTKYSDAKSGSWTKSLRPDYTLTVWPAEKEEAVAEKEEMIVHIHFDSKYRVDHFAFNPAKGQGNDDIDLLEEEKEEERRGVYKNADLLKMHAYKDAIRRTGGAYVLYPGTESQEPLRGFHEIIPGLGAFAIRPSENSGLHELSSFIDKVVNHFMDRTSQREIISSKVYDVHKNHKSDDNIMLETMPEYVGGKRLILEDVCVLVGYYKSPEHLQWILETHRYNFRTGKRLGSFHIRPQEANAQYLLLHTGDETKTSRIFKLNNLGPRIFSTEDLVELKYPNPKPGNFYLVYDIYNPIEPEFINRTWDISMLTDYKNGEDSALPFSTTLADLMNCLVK
ncbi:MAG: DUF2357 domain-containing protein [Flavobacterium sp.]|nr:MAG: DUF2357 domain-containing protein [Flavobacterium sp.]